jgi:nicotinamidase-related amidase
MSAPDPGANPDLHGSAPDQHPVALLLIDVINAFDFPEAEQLLRSARPAANRIAELKRKARAADVPVVYVNDNFGKWRSDFRQVVEACGAPDSKGRDIVKLLAPDEDDYFVLKPKHTGFYASALELLLRKLGARQVVLTGFAGNICVLFTANDAYMRDLSLFVPSDCSASNTEHDQEHALRQMRTLLKAETAPSSALRFTRDGVEADGQPSGR